MNTSSGLPIVTVAEFLVHAITLEQESVERYEELADSMEVHNNPEISKLFRKLARYGELHASEIEQLAAGMDLPEISPWDFKWSTPEAPESGPMEEVHYLMNRHQALDFALLNEERGRDFYAQVANSSPSEEVRSMAAGFTAEEDEHVELLKVWIRNLDELDSQTTHDPDPPNITE